MLDYQVPQKIILARIKVLVAKVPIVCSALDYQGGDSGQITSGCWGGGEMVSGSCSPYKNRKLVSCFRFYLSVQMGPARCTRIENLFSSTGFICLQVFCSNKGGQNNKGNGPRQESEKG